MNLEGELDDQEIMDRWMSGTQGPAYVLGSDIFSVIDAQLGLPAALEAARDYRKLLVIYNDAARRANASGESRHIFDEDLAARAARYTGR